MNKVWAWFKQRVTVEPKQPKTINIRKLEAGVEEVERRRLEAGMGGVRF